MRVKRIVVGLDGSEGSNRAAEWSAVLARDLQADVIAVHGVPLIVMGPPAFPALPMGDEQIRKELHALLDEEWSAPLRKADIPHRSVVEWGTPADVIMQVADREGADLIVVGSRGRGGFAGLLLGSVSQQVAHHARQPVVVVPPERRAG